jgi:hypothetical protein
MELKVPSQLLLPAGEVFHWNQLARYLLLKKSVPINEVRRLILQDFGRRLPASISFSLGSGGEKG